MEKVILSAENNISEVIALNSDSEGKQPQSFSHLTSQRTIKQLDLLKKQLRIANNSLNKARELEIFLRQNSIRLSNAVSDKIVSHETRIVALKRQLAVWAESIQVIDFLNFICILLINKN